jgi:hypothetical protein
MDQGLSGGALMDAGRFGLMVIVGVIVWVGYELACGLILLCRWTYARWTARAALRRTLTAWERVEKRRTQRARMRAGSMR